jgi:hypothetical protein
MSPYSSLPHASRSLCVGIIFISYALQVKFKPFLDPNLDAADRLAVHGPIPGEQLVYVRGVGGCLQPPTSPPRRGSRGFACGRSSFGQVHVYLALHPTPTQTFNYNALETLLLVTSMFILLAGMTFQSGVTASGSGAYTALTVLVAVVLVGCVGVFVAMLAREVWNSVRFAKRRHSAAGQRGTLVDPARHSRGKQLAPLSWVPNPLKGTPAGAAVEDRSNRPQTSPGSPLGSPWSHPLAPPPPPPPPSPIGLVNPSTLGSVGGPGRTWADGSGGSAESGQRMVARIAHRGQRVSIASGSPASKDPSAAQSVTSIAPVPVRSAATSVAGGGGGTEAP